MLGLKLNRVSKKEHSAYPTETRLNLNSFKISFTQDSFHSFPSTWHFAQSAEMIKLCYVPTWK